MRSLMRNGVFVVHVFTTAVICGLSTLSALTWMQSPHPKFLWYAASWPYKSGLWAILLGLIGLAGIIGTVVMAGALRRNKYIILTSTTLVASGHAHVAQSIWESYHFATGVSTYPLIFCLSMWVFWLTSSKDSI